MFNNEILNAASFVLAVLTVLALVGFISWNYSKKEANRIKYGGVRYKMKKAEPETQVEEFEVEAFRK